MPPAGASRSGRRGPGAVELVVTVALVALVAVACFSVTAAHMRLLFDVDPGDTKPTTWAGILAMVVWRPGLFPEALLAAALVAPLIACQRQGWRAALIAVVPLLLVYLGSWARWSVLGTPVTLTDVDALSAVAAALPWWQLGAGAALVLAWLGALVANLAVPRASALACGLAAVAVPVAAGALAPRAVLSALDRLRPIEDVEPVVVVFRNGTLVQLVRQALQARVIVEDTPATHEAPALGALPPPVRRPAIYLVSLESFIDPRDLRAVPGADHVLDPRFAAWLDESRSRLLVPVFGSGSARSELEVLCGVPSYGLLGIEYRRLGGAPIPCLPRRLHEWGYQTFASIAMPPHVYNYAGAYRSFGIEDAFFRPAFDLSDLDGVDLAAASQFAQTRAAVAGRARPGAPQFVLVVSNVGHWPFTTDETRRPAMVPGMSAGAHIANAAAYTSRAVASLVEAVERDAPDAIVVIFGDHLPPPRANEGLYVETGYRMRWRPDATATAFWEADGATRFDRYATPLIIRQAGRVVPVGLVAAYALPEIVLDLASDGAYCRAFVCASRAPILYRPIDQRATFTSAAAFPLPACTGPHDVAACADAQALDRRLRLAYRQLIADAAGTR